MFRRSWRLMCGCCGVVLSLVLSGCMPALNVTPISPAKPTVTQLQDHISCVLYQSMDAHLGPYRTIHDSDDFALWRRLIDYNFFDTVNLTLFITQTEGLNPSINFVTPLTNVGHSLVTTTSTTNTFNETLSVGLQLNGTQDQNFVLNYVVDLHKLYNEAYQAPDGTFADIYPETAQYRPGGLHDTCSGGSARAASGGPSYNLSGDLEITDQIEAGLLALDRLRAYPSSVGSSTGGGKASQSSASAASSQSSGAATGFSQKVDFNLMWGANGGPNWSLLKFKGPAGGGSGASAQLLSYGRTNQDTLISTYSATCKSDRDTPLMVPQPTASRIEYDEKVPGGADIKPPKPDAIQVTGRWNDPAGLTWDVDIVISTSVLKAGPGEVTDSSGAIYLDRVDEKGKDHNFEGFISWSGLHHEHSWTFRGTITDTRSGTALGPVYLGFGYKGAKMNELVVSNLIASSNGLSLLTQESTLQPSKYWELLPSCSEAGPFLPNSLNFLQQLPAPVGATILQN